MAENVGPGRGPQGEVIPDTYVDPNATTINKGLGGLGAQAPAQDKPPSPLPGEGPAQYAMRLKKWREEQKLKQKKIGGLDPATLTGVVMQQMAGNMGMGGSLEDAVNGGGMFQRPDDNLNQAIASIMPLLGQG